MFFIGHYNESALYLDDEQIKMNDDVKMKRSRSLFIQI